MASTQERDELRRLADELPDEAVHNVLQVARVVSSSAEDTSTVSFELDGVQYEVDLTSENSEERVREALAKYVEFRRRYVWLRERGNRPAAKTIESDDAGQSRNTPRTRERPAWIGAGHLGPDFASRAKDVLRDEMGQRNA